MKKIDRLIKKIIIKGEILTITGLHIGAANSSMSIGGMDNPVIRNPITDEPYIPGSSLKGKMRAMLEILNGEIGKGNKTQNTASNNPRHISARLHGYTGYKNDNDKNSEFNNQQPSRLIVRDCFLLNKEELGKTDLLYTESKMETTIDRITAEANPRPIERVPAGAKFGFELVLNIFESDVEEKINEQLIKSVFKSLQLVQDDYIGGSGSRGSGQVRFQINEIFDKDINFYSNATIDLLNKISDYKSHIPNDLNILDNGK